MYKLELQWKEYNLDLEAIDAKMRLDYPDYTGNQAHSSLELWFSTEPSQEAKDAIMAYWDGLSNESDEAESYRSRQQIEDAKAALKQGLLAKDWNSMSQVERKAAIGMDVSKAELISAEIL